MHKLVFTSRGLLLIFLPLLFSLMTACQPQESIPEGEGATERPCAAETIDDVNEIYIGATAPFSKPGAADQGLAMMIGFQIAERDINAAGGVLGKPIRVFVDDTAGLPERGKEVAERFIKESCVVGIVGEYHSDVGLAIMEVAHQYHIPTIFAETYSDDITAAQYPEIFRIAPTSSFTAQLDAKWIADVGDYNSDGTLFTVIIAEDTSFGLKQIERAGTWFPEFGIEHETLMVDFSAKDFADPMKEIQSFEKIPDVILIKVTGETSLILLNQIITSGLGPNQQTLVVANQVALDDDKFWEMVPNGNFVIVPRIGPWPSTATQQGLDFAQKYAAVRDNWPEAFAFEAYDSVWLLAEAINRAGSLDPDAIISALEDSHVQLTSGTYTFPFGENNPTEGFVPDYMWHQWPDVPLLLLQYTQTNQNSADMAVIWPPTYQTIDGSYVSPEK